MSDGREVQFVESRFRQSLRQCPGQGGYGCSRSGGKRCLSGQVSIDVNTSQSIFRIDHAGKVSPLSLVDRNRGDGLYGGSANGMTEGRFRQFPECQSFLSTVGEDRQAAYVG